jgi:hypothetical protein
MDVVYCENCGGWTDCTTYTVIGADNLPIEVSECTICESVYID